MPLYEYICEACGHQFEVIQKFSDPPLEKCPKCGAPVRKLQSAPAFQFKGSGWYITDYARKDQAPASKSEGATADGSKTAEKKDSATEKKETPAAAEKPAAKSSDASPSTTKST
jgi:putative FmdB family regulatory protein